MRKWHADDIGDGINHEYGVDVYLASEVDEVIERLRGIIAEFPAELRAAENNAFLDGRDTERAAWESLAAYKDYLAKGSKLARDSVAEAIYEPEQFSGTPLGNYRCGIHDVRAEVRDGKWWCSECAAGE
jgi:hypothetical protein